MAQSDPVKQMLPSVRRLTKFISLLAVVVGPLLFLLPGHTDRLFAWTIKPSLTAAFLGANHFTALVIELLSARERVWARARVAYPAMFVFTTLTTLATLIHRDKFHFHAPALAARATTWAWFVVYIAVVPIMGAVLLLQMRAPGINPRSGAPMANGARILLGMQAICMIAIGGALFIAPAQTNRIWPWMLTLLTGRAVGAWLAGLGLAAACAAWENNWERSRAAMAGNLVAGALQLIALSRFTGTVTWSKPNAWIYLAFLVFMLALGLYGVNAGYRLLGDVRGASSLADRIADQPA
jgi:hypothetical protein